MDVEKERAQKAVDNYQTYERDFAPKGISLDDYWEKLVKS